jgi:hypothetical protein
MPNIIERGMWHFAEATWWIGLELKCQTRLCGCRFELIEGDILSAVVEHNTETSRPERGFFTGIVSINCPICKLNTYHRIPLDEDGKPLKKADEVQTVE